MQRGPVVTPRSEAQLPQALLSPPGSWMGSQARGLEGGDRGRSPGQRRTKPGRRKHKTLQGGLSAGGGRGVCAPFDLGSHHPLCFLSPNPQNFCPAAWGAVGCLPPFTSRPLSAADRAADREGHTQCLPFSTLGSKRLGWRDSGDLGAGPYLLPFSAGGGGSERSKVPLLL